MSDEESTEPASEDPKPESATPVEEEPGKAALEDEARDEAILKLVEQGRGEGEGG